MTRKCFMGWETRNRPCCAVELMVRQLWVGPGVFDSGLGEAGCGWAQQGSRTGVVAPGLSW